MRRNMIRQLPISLLCAGALVFGAVACSDDDDTSSADEPSSTTLDSTGARSADGHRDFDFDDALQPGTYFIDPDLDPSTPSG